MSAKPSYQITPYSVGSIKEIAYISFPLILGYICNGMMIIIDRLMLSRYSINSVNSAATAGAAATAILALPIVIAGISEVFVGRYHGESQSHKIGSSVWQMIWFSLMLVPIFFATGWFLSPYLFQNTSNIKEASIYFSVFIGFGSIFCMNQSLIGFFLGQGKIQILTLVIISVNLLNALLDYFFIYGISFIPQMGIKGAAAATVVSQFFLFGTLFAIFLNKQNRQKKGALNWKIDKSLLLDSLKVGAPSSLAHFCECASFFLFLNLVSNLSSNYLTTIVFLNTIYMIFYFFIEGISKGTTAICSNLVGAFQQHLIAKCYKAACKLHFLFVLLALLILVFKAEFLFSLFVSKNDLSLLADSFFLSQLKYCSILLCASYLFDGLIWIIVGILTASSDTKFIIWVGCFGPWVLFILSFFSFSYGLVTSVTQIWFVICIYCFLVFSTYWLRFRFLFQKKINLQVVSKSVN